MPRGLANGRGRVKRLSVRFDVNPDQAVPRRGLNNGKKRVPVFRPDHAGGAQGKPGRRQHIVCAHPARCARFGEIRRRQTAHTCGTGSGTTRSEEMVIMHPSLRIVMMTREMTGSVKAAACAMSPAKLKPRNSG